MIPRSLQLLSFLCLLLLQPACITKEENPLNVDNDGDGWTEFEGDCDDGDVFTYLGAAENEPELCARDYDGDGWGASSSTWPIERGADCDDSDPYLTPADSDADGYSTCDGDCDDVNAVDMLDSDSDGYTLCSQQKLPNL